MNRKKTSYKGLFPGELSFKESRKMMQEKATSESKWEYGWRKAPSSRRTK